MLLFSSSIRAHCKALSCLCVSFAFLTRFWLQIRLGVSVITVLAWSWKNVIPYKALSDGEMFLFLHSLIVHIIIDFRTAQQSSHS